MKPKVREVARELDRLLVLLDEGEPVPEDPYVITEPPGASAADAESL